MTEEIKESSKLNIPAIDPNELIVRNTQGSTAGSGSGDFHQYRTYRRKEYFRLEKIDRDHKEVIKQEEFQKRREERILKESLITAKKASKRNRLKQLKKENKKLQQLQKQLIKDQNNNSNDKSNDKSNDNSNSNSNNNSNNGSNNNSNNKDGSSKYNDIIK
eukprot:TRINITY_DN610_c0_g1_i1.p1 TRINITY_DN610_c0_g1~~TRINITY_DN610_c0_g1_i1.p1  ORF type:complete len:161 (-),score=70.00 TRINITY_DN610_c0_g1_i1:81-563(-)